MVKWPKSLPENLVTEVSIKLQQMQLKPNYPLLTLVKDATKSKPNSISAENMHSVYCLYRHFRALLINSRKRL
jgi:hypothetical protein